MPLALLLLAPISFATSATEKEEARPSS